MNRSGALIRATTLAQDLALSDAGRGLLRNDLSADQFLAALNSHQLYADGALLLSRWLPVREAVWWACQCVWHLNRPVLPRKAEEDALRSAVKWVIEPTEPNRRARRAGGKPPAWRAGRVHRPRSLLEQGQRLLARSARGRTSATRCRRHAIARD